jgi:hypothetical protein
MKKHLLVTLLFLCSLQTFAQKAPREWYLNLNINRYIPTEKWQESGMGIGFGGKMIMPLKKKFILKNSADILLNTYSDGAFNATDNLGQSLGSVGNTTGDLSIGLISTIHYSFHKNFSVGTGLGLRTLLGSATAYTGIAQYQNTSTNDYYKRFMPVLPIEMSLKIDKILLNLRYEYSLLNKIKGDLADYKTERYGIVSLEVGYKIK